MKAFDYKGFCDSCNTVMQRSKDEFYNEGIRRAMAIAKHFTRVIPLQREVDTLVCNANGHVSPDVATRQVINKGKLEGTYERVFGPYGDEDYD